MTLQYWVNSAGLLCNIIGAALLWKFGLAPNVGPAGRRYLQTGIIEPGDAAAARRNRRFSTLGFVLLLIGFALQLLSNFLAGIQCDI